MASSERRCRGSGATGRPADRQQELPVLISAGKGPGARGRSFLSSLRRLDSSRRRRFSRAPPAAGAGALLDPERQDGQLIGGDCYSPRPLPRPLSRILGRLFSHFPKMTKIPAPYFYSAGKIADHSGAAITIKWPITCGCRVFDHDPLSGPDGSRTHVRKQIPFPSTIIVRFEASPPIKDAHVFYRPVSSDTPGARRNWIRRFSHSRSQILKV